MNLYGKLPQERAMQKLIHDTNSAFSTYNNKFKKMDQWLFENAKSLKESGLDIVSFYTHIEYLKSAKLQLQTSIDDYYKKFSAGFPDNNLNQKEETK